jgi:hypothetical protein
MLQKPTKPVLEIDMTELLAAEGMFVGFWGSLSNVTSSYDSMQNQAYGLGYTISHWTFNSDGLPPDLPRASDGTILQYGEQAYYRRSIDIFEILSLGPLGLIRCQLLNNGGHDGYRQVTFRLSMADYILNDCVWN